MTDEPSPSSAADLVDASRNLEPHGCGVVRDRCTATSKRSGERCKRWPVPGLAVCSMHGGATRAAKAKAERVQQLERAQRIATREFGPVPIDPSVAVLSALWSANGLMLYLQPVVAELSRRDVGDSAGIIGVNHLGDGAQHVAVLMLAQAEERVARFSKAAHDMGIAEQRIRVATEQANTLASVLRLALSDLGHDLASPDVARVIAVRLRELQPAIDVEEVDE